jgi:hypothetical protein
MSREILNPITASLPPVQPQLQPVMALSWSHSPIKAPKQGRGLALVLLRPSSPVAPLRRVAFLTPPLFAICRRPWYAAMPPLLAELRPSVSSLPCESHVCTPPCRALASSTLAPATVGQGSRWFLPVCMRVERKEAEEMRERVKCISQGPVGKSF